MPATHRPDTGRPTSYRTVLADGEFRAVLVAHLLSMLAVIVTDVAVAVLVFHRTGSPLLAAVTFAVGMVPMGLGAVVLGGVGARRPSRDVLVGCQLVVAALVTLMAVPGLPVPVLLALLAVKGTVDPVFAGTRSATLTEIVGPEGFPLARSLLRIVAQNAQFAGYAGGGAALLVVTPAQAIGAAAGCHAASTLLLLAGTRRRHPGRSQGARLQGAPSQGAGAPAHPLQALRALLAVPGIRPVLAMFWLPLFFAVAPEALAIPYATHLGGSSLAVGLLLTGLPAGSLLGELLCGCLLNARRRVRLLVPLAVGGFLPVLAFALGPPLAVAVALLVVAGLGTSHLLGLDQVALDALPEELRRRGFTLLMAGQMVSQGLGFAAAGTLAEWLPVTTVIPLLAATGATVTSIAGLWLCRTVDSRAGSPAARRNPSVGSPG